MSEKISPELVQITDQNYSRFKALVHWRVTGTRVASVSEPTEEELAFTSREGYWIWAAELRDELVGWISFVLIPKPDHRIGMIFVDELWTADDYRRKGVAEALMTKAIQQARNLRLWKVRLYVGKDNPAARAFYKKMGLSEDDEAIFCQLTP